MDSDSNTNGYPDVLYQERPEKTRAEIGLELEKIKKELRELPAHKQMYGLLLQAKMARLENEIRASFGVEPLEEKSDIGLAEKVLDEHKNGKTDSIQTGANGVSGVQDIKRTGGIPKPPQYRVSGNATAIGQRGVAGGRPVARESQYPEAGEARYTAHFAVVPVAFEMQRSLDRIHEGFARVKHQLSAKGQEAIAKEVDWFETRYTQAYLESETLPQALKIAERAVDAGYYIVVARERWRKLDHRISTQPREFITLDELDIASGGSLKQILPSVTDIFAALQSRFGNVGDYSGDTVDYEQRREVRKHFLAGRLRVIYAAYGSGMGTLPLCDADYPELGITGGAKPRVSIFLAPPRSAPLVMDTARLTWRASAKSDVHVVFLSTDSRRDAELLQQKVGPLLRAIGGTVVGERVSVSEQISGMTEGARETALEAALAFAEGKEQKVNATMYQVRSKSQKPTIDDWSQIDFPPAESAKSKRCNAAKELTDAEVNTQYLSDFGLLTPDSRSDASGSKLVEAVGNAAASGEGQWEGIKAHAVEPAGREVALSLTSDAAIHEQLGHVRASVKNADQKAMFLLAALIAILAFLITHNAPSGWFRGLGQWSFADWVGLAATLGLTVAASMMLAVLYPSLTDSGSSLRFLDAITRPGESKTPGNGLPSRPADHHIAALQEEFYELTKVCIVKYRNLRYGFWAGAVAAFISLLFLILSKKPHPIYHRTYY